MKNAVCTLPEKSKDNSNKIILSGIGVGVYGLTSYLITGTICPSCLIITPYLLTRGFYKKVKNKEETKNEAQS